MTSIENVYSVSHISANQIGFICPDMIRVYSIGSHSMDHQISLQKTHLASQESLYHYLIFKANIGRKTVELSLAFFEGAICLYHLKKLVATLNERFLSSYYFNSSKSIHFYGRNLFQRNRKVYFVSDQLQLVEADLDTIADDYKSTRVVRSQVVMICGRKDHLWMVETKGAISNDTGQSNLS